MLVLLVGAQACHHGAEVWLRPSVRLVEPVIPVQWICDRRRVVVQPVLSCSAPQEVRITQITSWGKGSVYPQVLSQEEYLIPAAKLHPELVQRLIRINALPSSISPGSPGAYFE